MLIYYIMNVDDKFYFYSASANKPAGYGAKECVHDYSKYVELNKIKNWRKMLSNFYVSEFVYEGYTYYTAEHAFQSKKIQLVDKEKAHWFCKESGHEIGNTANGLIARKNRKLVILNDYNLQLWHEIKHEIMREILLCKFSNEHLKNVLLLTKDAQLTHGTFFGSVERQYDLEYVRSVLSET